MLNNILTQIRAYQTQIAADLKIYLRKFALDWRKSASKGQAVFEYAIILGVVVLALGLMQTYVRRGIQAGIKVAADEVGLQKDSVDLDPTKGTTQGSLVDSLSFAEREVATTAGGERRIVLDEKSQSSGRSEYWSNWEEK